MTEAPGAFALTLMSSYYLADTSDDNICLGDIPDPAVNGTSFAHASSSLTSSLYRVAAVNHKRVAGDQARSIRSQEYARSNELFRPPQSPHGDGF